MLDALIYALQKGSADLAPFSERLGTDLVQLFKEKLSIFADCGYLTVKESTVAFTRDGVFFGNNIISELINTLAGS